MAETIIRRLLLSLPTLFGMSLLAFLVVHLAPGDPASAILGQQYSAENAARLNEHLGVDEPLYEQYYTWLVDALHGRFGNDFETGYSTGRLLLERLPVTVQLTVMSLILAILIAIPLGTAAAVWRNRAPDKIADVLAMLGISVPGFWVGIMLILLFSLKLRWLPSFGYVPLREDPIESVKHMLLPALALGVELAAVLILVTRAAVVETLQSNYIRFCRANGLSETSVVIKHALRNAAIPIVTVIGLQAGYLLGGAIIIESVFSLPGVGTAVLGAVNTRNYPLVQASVLMIGLMFIFANLASDLLYTVLNPRLRATQG